MRLVTLAAGILAVAVVVAGCGSSGDAQTEISRAEFVRQANALCHDTEVRLKAGIARLLAGNEPSNGREVVKAEAEVGRKVLIPAMEDQAEKIEALGAPNGDAAKVHAIVRATEEGLGKAEKHPERAVKDGTEAFGKANRLARAYGLSAC
jgi:hypothetical protein